MSDFSLIPSCLQMFPPQWLSPLVLFWTFCWPTKIYKIVDELTGSRYKISEHVLACSSIVAWLFWLSMYRFMGPYGLLCGTLQAKRMLKNLRIMTRHTKMEFRITGLSEMPCNQQLYVTDSYTCLPFLPLFSILILFARRFLFCVLSLLDNTLSCSFPLRVRNSHGETQMVDITVYDYFMKTHKMQLTWSAHMPCLDVGKPKRPNYLPIEVCNNLFANLFQQLVLMASLCCFIIFICSCT